MSNPMGRLKFLLLDSNALANPIICDGEIVFMDPNETNRTEVSGFESNQSLQMLRSLFVRALFSIGNKELALHKQSLLSNCKVLALKWVLEGRRRG
ncbi:hypothetical protein V6N12_033715 [Hibiscus sabdariffa]|uniref:Uncharacterized protein n=1 Tax=Hibiscus sabdariffa TaxID=183260 RepID=A0ABR2AIJ2_9ROSI